MNIYQYARAFVIDNEVAITISIVLIGLFFVLIPHTSAYLQVAQGDPVYMNETLDISLAVSYPKYQIAWCSANNYDCDPPDQVIDASENPLEKYWLDPSIFKYGTYYRWDGEWHPAENAIAFTILPGERPIKKINQTVNKTEVPNQIKEREGPYNYLIARGDSPTIYTVLNRSDSCQLWIFSNTMDTYDMALSYSNDTYSRKLTEGETMAMEAGEYGGYIQCNGNNGWQDIMLMAGELDTPYDDRLVQDVPIISWNLLNVKRQFDQLALNIPRFDDKLIPIKIAVVEPTITITNVEQDEDKLYLMGSTSWSNETPITVKLDPDNYKLDRDIKLHTWQTFATGTIDAPRTFATALPLDKKELSIGWHEIEMSNPTKINMAVSSYRFYKSDVYIMPTPTPEVKMMIYGKDFEEIPVKIEPTPEPTVNITTEEAANVSTTRNITINITTNATLAHTVEPTTIPTANETIPTIPMPTMLSIAALLISFFVWRLS